MRAFAVLVSACAVAAVPEQIHLSYTGKASELSVDFVATSAIGYVTVEHPQGTFVQVNSTSFHFAQIGFMHQALLQFPGIAPGQAASYTVTSAGETTPAFTVVPDVSGPEKHVVFGDFGLVNDVVMNELAKEAKAGTFDSVLHVGDWAYDFEDVLSLTGNVFMGLVQQYAAIKPVMPAEGNHEACTTCDAVAGLSQSGQNFTQYKGRFHAVQMYAGANSGSNSNRFYSFSRGLSHFVVLTAEAYLYARTPAFLANQLAWLQADLAAVDRRATPWIVILAHKDWTMAAEAFQAFQPLLDAARVDLLFCGHVHYYNRYMPYDSVTGEVDQASVSADGSVYTEPKYMTVVVTGASGDVEKDDKYTPGSPSYTGSENYGYGIFTALNRTHATWSFKTVRADGGGPADYTDNLTIVRAH